MSDAVEKLVLAILLSATKKRAQVVDFLVDGVRIEEMRPPLELRAPVFDQLKRMASDEGVIELAIGDDHRFFTVAFTERGTLHRCEIRVATAR